MEVQQLRHLLAAVQYGNLVKAAEVCHISQSGLSRSIKSLETRLGVQLLIRSPSGVEPTIYGSSVLDRARVILNEVRRSTQEVKEIRAGRGGSVSIGVTHNFAHTLMPDILAELGRQPRPPKIQVTTAAFPVIVDLVKTGEIDFGFGLLGAIGSDAGLKVEEVGAVHSRIVARSDHPLAGKSKITSSQLSKADWALLDSTSLYGKVASYFEARGRAMPLQALKTNSVPLLKSMLLRADLLSLLPIDMVRVELETGQLVAIDAEPPSEVALTGLVFREDAYLSPPIERLVKEIKTRACSGESDPFRYRDMQAEPGPGKPSPQACIDAAPAGGAWIGTSGPHLALRPGHRRRSAGASGSA